VRRPESAAPAILGCAAAWGRMLPLAPCVSESSVKISALLGGYSTSLSRVQGAPHRSGLDRWRLRHDAAGRRSRCQ